MKIPQQGFSKEQVLQELEKRRGTDIRWREGKTFGYIFDAGKEVEEVCKTAYMGFLSENALDPTVFPSLLQLENEIVAMARNHLGGDSEVAGCFTSGGTESIILAIKAARDYSKNHHPHIKEPEIILPVTAHAAFWKAAHYLNVKAVTVDVDPKSFCAQVEKIKEAITPNTILLMGSAPSYAHGVIDPIPEIAQLAKENNLLCHVDGCIGGFLLPYFRELGAEIPSFDFSVSGVTSISMDFHKYAYAAKGASVILYKNKELRKPQFFCCADWTGYSVVNSTIQSSKSGGPLAGTWTVLQYIGHEGYLELAKSLREAAQKFIAGIQRIPELEVLGKPDMSLVAVGSESVNVFHIIDEMKTRGWYIQPQLAVGKYKENFHISIQPSNVDKIEQMLKDLESSVATAKTLPDMSLFRPMIEQAVSQVGEGDFDPQMVATFMQMAGVQGTKLPERTAMINGILNLLPKELQETILTDFFSHMFTCAENA